jgi:hypothetical protein
MNDRAIVRSFEKGWGQRLGIMALAVLVAAVLVVVGMGFKGRHIARSAAALTPVTIPTTPVAPSSAH